MSTSEEKNINQYNAEGNAEGYWEFNYNGYLMFKGNYINGIRHGCWEHYFDNGKLSYIGNYIKEKSDGYWEYYDKEGNLIKETFYVNI